MSTNYRAYWDQNINRWGDLYLDISHGHEKFDRRHWVTWAYNHSIGRIERRLMKERYRITIEFLDHYAKPGITITDLGCGTGIFVVEAARRGAKVNAIDFSGTALAMTRRAVESLTPQANVGYTEGDVQTVAIPPSDACLAMGLTPYITDLEAFLNNVLPTTRALFCLYVDPSSWQSRVRSALPLLNVRELNSHARETVDGLYARHGFVTQQRRRFASGYIDLAIKA
jgi:SAM-dependent methyltransferase